MSQLQFEEQCHLRRSEEFGLILIGGEVGGVGGVGVAVSSSQGGLSTSCFLPFALSPFFLLRPLSYSPPPPGGQFFQGAGYGVTGPWREQEATLGVLPP